MANPTYVVFELAGHVNGERIFRPSGVKQKHLNLHEWQQAAMKRIKRGHNVSSNWINEEMLAKAGNVYKIQGRPNRPIYVVSEAKTNAKSGLGMTFEDLYNNNLQVKKYLEGRYGGSGTKNQVTNNLSNKHKVAAKMAVEKYLSSRKNELPFETEFGTILNAKSNAQRKELIIMNKRGKLIQITMPSSPRSKPSSPRSSSGSKPSSSSSKPSSSGSKPSSSGAPPPSFANAFNALRIPTNTKVSNAIKQLVDNEVILDYLRKKYKSLSADFEDLPSISDTTNQTALRRAFKRLTLKYHSNKTKNNNAKAKFMNIRNALEYLNA